VPDAFLPDKCLYDFLSAVPLSILADIFVLESTLLIFEPLVLPNLLPAAFGYSMEANIYLTGMVCSLASSTLFKKGVTFTFLPAPPATILSLAFTFCSPFLSKG